MKTLLLICFLTLAFWTTRSDGLSVRSVLGKFVSLFESGVQDNEGEDAPKQCQVAHIPAVENINMEKFSGDWYEIGRTATKLPEFKSAVWRFSVPTDEATSTFHFAARLVNGECLKPITGEAVSSTTNPGTIIFNYDALKSKVEEELKLIQTDYTDVAVFYGCRRVLEDGTCHEEGSFVSVLSRSKSVQPPLLDTVKFTVRSACVDVKSVIQQNSADSCDIAKEGDDKNPMGKQEPSCKNVATCTLTCPKACHEDVHGCVSCSPNDDKTNVPFCNDISRCPAHCVEENEAGCSTCKCMDAPTFYQSPGADGAIPSDSGSIDDQSYPISSVLDCPTSCRTIKKETKLFCDCSNGDTCNNLPVDCKGNEESYYFDHRTQTCHAFFGKCQGNRNRFSSSKDCMAVCADVCSLPPDLGPCRGNVERFYFNQVQGQCVTFVYGGCQGNENNFASKSECIQRCPESFGENTQHSPIDPVCKVKEDRGSCKENELRYHYDEASKSCKTFFYGGCDGNGNNFESKEACERKCSQSSKSECEIDDCGKCKTIVKADGCFECDCTGSATGISVSVATVFTLVTLTLLNC